MSDPRCLRAFDHCRASGVSFPGGNGHRVPVAQAGGGLNIDLPVPLATVLSPSDEFKVQRQTKCAGFTRLAERYERGSVMLTSDLPFSKWDNIFKDPLTTAAAIDRLVHHSVILEVNLPSYRLESAKKSKAAVLES